MTKTQLNKILDKIETQFPSNDEIYEDVDNFYEAINDLLDDSVEYLTWDLDNDTYEFDTAFEEVIESIQNREKKGKLVKAYTSRMIGSMLVLLISYK